MASPIFSTPKNPKSLESLAQGEIRALLKLYHQKSTLVVAADTHPGIFAHALNKVQKGEKFVFRGINLVGSRSPPSVYLVKCQVPDLLVGGLRLDSKFGNNQSTLEECLFDIIEEAFLAIGFFVGKRFPDRYHREWVV